MIGATEGNAGLPDISITEDQSIDAEFYHILVDQDSPSPVTQFHYSLCLRDGCS
jgi:hypothetical protein